MLGLIVKYADTVYKVGIPEGGVFLAANTVQNKFILEASGESYPCIGVFQKFRENIEFEIEVAEFDEASEPLSEYVNPVIVDPDYEKMKESEEEWMLRRFHEIEAILRDEGELD